MINIVYCVEKASKKKGEFPFNHLTVHSLKDIDKKKSAILILDVGFLKKRSKINALSFPDKICFVYFSKNSKSNASLLQKGDFFDLFTPDDSVNDMHFKINRAIKAWENKRQISNLEMYLIEKNKKIEKLVLIDPLTGCYNWRYFLNSVTQELSRSRRHLHSVSFIGVDIDHFRQVNEIYGIQVADMVTKELVNVLRKNLRDEDILARWRSDEFFVVMPYLESKDAEKVAHRIQQAIEIYKFKYRQITLSIKASLGVLSSPEDNIYNTRDIVSALDKCLTTAKRRGGNTVILYRESKIKPGKKPKPAKGNIKDLRKKIDKMNMVLTRDLLEMIYGFARAIEAKDFYTGKHVEYTANIAEEIAKNLNLTDSEVENVKHAAVLHDLGKVGIDKSILIKPGKLTPEEFETIKKHPSIGAEILREIHALRGAVPAVLYHHEKYDGSGYPLGLKGEEIPLSARIVAISDVYQALVSDRPYRKGFTQAKAIDIIKKESGTHFDPKIVEIFLKVIKKLK